MGGVQDNNWFDLMIDEIGVALTIVDKSIQKSMELWTELTKDILDEQPTQDTTGQPNNGKSGKEDSSQDKPVAEIKEGPIQHWAMRLGEAKQILSQHWAMSASKIPERLIQQQGDDDCDDYDDDDDDYDDEEEEEEEEEEESRVSDSSESMLWEHNLETSATSHPPNCYHHHKEAASVSSFKWKGGHELSKDVDTPSEEDGQSWDSSGDDEGEEDDESQVSESCENMWELNLGTLATSHIPSYHHRSEEDDGLSSRWRSGYELLKNDDKSSEEEEESWDNDEEVMERNHGIVSDVSNESLVCHVDDEDEDEVEDEDDVWDKLEGFVDVKEEEESSEVETVSPECDWVYVTRD
ncbi:unnamed protein product [Thlaspi arvense]|uniref:Uncharacterized protein n=1 Tax=Thlaspi arvense TaxID=13288 RepID=A0AAU9S6W0_THLAR|nr:unnamed protein product [Thlaspi arvense]